MSNLREQWNHLKVARQIPPALRPANAFRESQAQAIESAMSDWEHAATSRDFIGAVRAIRIALSSVVRRHQMGEVNVSVTPSGTDPREAYIAVEVSVKDADLAQRIQDFLEDQWRERAKTSIDGRTLSWEF